MIRRDTGINAVIFVFLSALIFITKLKVLNAPYYWDELGWVKGAYWFSAAKSGLFRFLPGLYPRQLMLGHPPLLRLSLAVLYKLFGQSIWLSHFFIVFISFLGVYFTYLLAASLFDRKTGVFSALFLFFSPLYFAQSSMFLGDLPVASFGIMSAYFALRKKYAPYLLCSSCMLLIKENGIAVVLSIIIYLYLQGGTIKRRIFETAKYGAPILIIAFFFILQKIATGEFFYIYSTNFKLITVEPSLVIRQFLSVNRWLFFYQGRFFFTILIFLNFILYKEFKRRREPLLFLLIFVFSGYIYSFFYFLPRYLLPTLPYFYILGAWSLMKIVRQPLLQTASAGIMLLALLSYLYPASLNLDATYEWDLRYLDVVRTHQGMCGYIEENYPSHRILTIWPYLQQLQEPYLGYVKKPLKVANFFQNKKNTDDFDLILFSSPSTAGSSEFKDFITEHNLRLIKRIENGRIVSELYICRPDKQQDQKIGG